MSVDCAMCDGKGVVGGGVGNPKVMGLATCHACNGTGKMPEPVFRSREETETAITEQHIPTHDCEECSGSGEIDEVYITTIKGLRRVEARVSPSGVDDWWLVVLRTYHGHDENEGWGQHQQETFESLEDAKAKGREWLRAAKNARTSR